MRHLAESVVVFGGRRLGEHAGNRVSYVVLTGSVGMECEWGGTAVAEVRLMGKQVAKQRRGRFGRGRSCRSC
jgi:hypothetical protein